MAFRIYGTLQEYCGFQDIQHPAGILWLSGYRTLCRNLRNIRLWTLGFFWFFFCNNRRQPKAFSFQVVLDDGNVVNYMSSLKSEYGLDEGVNYRRTPIICSGWKLEVVAHEYNSLISIAAPFVYWRNCVSLFPQLPSLLSQVKWILQQIPLNMQKM